jgi:DNA polymerase-3 subunit alpha
MAALMTAEYGDTEKIARAIDECKRMGIAVLPPDVNYSEVGFTIENVADLPKEQLDRAISKAGDGKDAKQAIRFGLSAIKNVGIGAIESIMKAREKRPFKNLADLTGRIDTRLVNRRTLESLVKAGALDTFGARAPQLLVMDKVLDDAHKAAKLTANGQGSLFDGFAEDNVDVAIELDLPTSEEMPFDQLLQFERELLGFYLHEPPYMAHIRVIKDYTSLQLSQLKEEVVDISFEKTHIIGGVIQEVKRIFTKKHNQEMAFVRLFDGTGNIDCVVFPKLFVEVKDQLIVEQVVILSGKVDKREEEYSFLVNTVEDFDPEHARRLDLTEVQVEIPRNIDSKVLQQVNVSLKRYPGSAPISILIPDQAGTTFKKMNLAFTVEPGFELVQTIESLLGPGSIKIS